MRGTVSARGFALRAAALSRAARAPPQIAMVAEMFTLAAQKNIEKGLPGFRLQQWYFFACAAFFAYGRLLKSNLLMEVSENADWLPPAIGARAGGAQRGARASASEHEQPYAPIGAGSKALRGTARCSLCCARDAATPHVAALRQCGGGDPAGAVTAAPRRC
jgi:hypothetical protein